MPKQTFYNLPEDKRRGLVDIAIDEFADHDYRDVSISRIVARAGIAKGSFYQYFEDKRDLYFYLLDLATQEKLVFAQSQKVPDPRMGLFAYLRWFIDVGVHFQFSRPKLARLGYRALYGDAPFREETVQRFDAAARGYYRQLIDMGIAQGDVDPAIDHDLAAFVLSTLLSEMGNYLIERRGWDMSQVAQRALSEAERNELRATIDALLHILERGMGSAGKAPVDKPPG